MITREAADAAVQSYLRLLEKDMDYFGSALPQNASRPAHRLAVSIVKDYEFGWVYYYSTQEFIETGDFRYALGGNAPIIVDHTDGRMYSTGTAHPLEHYLNQFRAGIRKPI